MPVSPASVAALDGRGVGPEGLVDDGGDLEGGGEDQPRVGQDALAGPDLLRDDDEAPGREGGRPGDAERAPAMRVALGIGALDVEDGDVGREGRDEDHGTARERISSLLEGWVRFDESRAQERVG